ncbi:hypothetical protein ACTACD_14230 [Pseudomonas syringae]|uniref:hypothetical protein n=1 Tax=Pseudomonas syringae TaxID=317 RepID=UPI003F7743D4
MLLSKEFQQSLIDKSTKLDCFSIEIKQRAATKPFVFRGSGSIFFNTEGVLSLKLYDKAKKTSMAGMIKLAFSQPKGIVPENDYFDVTAKDSNGQVWKAKRVYIYDGLHATPHGTSIEIEIPSLRSMNKIRSPDVSFAVVVINGYRNLPLNEYRDESSGGKSLRGLRLKLGGLDIDFDQTKNHLKLSVSSTKSIIDEKVIQKLLDGLSLACGERFELVQTTIAANGKLIHILPHQGKNDSKKIPALVPLQYGEPEHLELFLTSYLENKKQKHAEILRHWSRMTECVLFSETSALIVCIAIEGMVKHFYKSTRKTDTKLIKAILDAKKAIKSCKLPAEINGRAMSAITSMSQKSIKKLLLEIVDDGYATKDHVASWSDLRNRTAHADAAQVDDQSFIKNINAYATCIDLFFILICKTMSYSGKRNMIDSLPAILTNR